MGHSLGHRGSNEGSDAWVLDTLAIVLVLGMLAALAMVALGRVDGYEDEPIPPIPSVTVAPNSPTPASTTPPTSSSTTPPRGAGNDVPLEVPPEGLRRHSDPSHNPNSGSPTPDTIPAVSGVTGGSAVGAVADKGATRAVVPQEQHWSALEGCDRANYLLDGARSEGKLSDEFYWILPQESNCRNDVVSYVGCCYGLLQLHRLFFNDDRLRELGLDHIVEGMHACGAFEIEDIYQPEARSWQVNICAAHVVYAEHQRIHPNEPAECAWDPYMKRYWSSCPSRHN